MKSQRKTHRNFQKSGMLFKPSFTHTHTYVCESLYVCVLSHFSHVQLFATPWTEARQVPLSMDSPGKNPGMGCHALLQGIFRTQESNLGPLSLRNCQVYSLPLASLVYMHTYKCICAPVYNFRRSYHFYGAHPSIHTTDHVLS